MRVVMAMVLVTAVTMSASAWATDARGLWLRSDGTARVRVAPCGAVLCGTVAWLQKTDGPGKVGQRVFYDMKPAGVDTWQGSAFNPQDGRTYSGTMDVSGNTLTTTGCVLGGLICKSVRWSRVE
jgi:uncharacterized protein (DUF2147 family)